MRDIKFRAFDSNIKLFGTVIELSYSPNYNSEYVPSYVRVHDYKDVTHVVHYYGDECIQDNFVIEQYTGLHDDNGREIYEGDVVQFKPFPYQRGVVIFEGFGFNIEGFWDSSYDCPSYAFSEGNNYEVIGNIHENPELLEGVDG